MQLLGFELRSPVTRVKQLSGVNDNRGSWWPWIREPYTGAWQRNEEWTTDTVLAHNAVYACITLIAQDVGKLRPKLVQQDANRIWTETESAAFSPVLKKPNSYQNHIQFKESWIMSKLIRGNTYVLKGRDNRGVVTRLYVLEPSRVKPFVAPDGSVFYELSHDNLSGIEEGNVMVPASEIIHDRMNCLFHPLVGVSPIFACGLSANLGLKIQGSSASFFGKGANPSGILTAPADIPPETAKRLAETWRTQFSGDNAGAVAVLGNGLSFTAMRMTSVDAQLIEQLKMSVETVCSTFHVPPFKIGFGAIPTYANAAESLNQIYYSDCLQSHIESFELTMDEGLGLGVAESKEGGKILGVELDLDALIRMDYGAQIKSLAEAVGGTLMSPNEARAKLDRKPKPGGDDLYMQQQYFSTAALHERDQEKPFAKPAPPTPGAPATPANPANDAGDDEEDEPEESEERGLGRLAMLALKIDRALAA